MRRSIWLPRHCSIWTCSCLAYFSLAFEAAPVFMQSNMSFTDAGFMSDKYTHLICENKERCSIKTTIGLKGGCKPFCSLLLLMRNGSCELELIPFTMDCNDLKHLWELLPPLLQDDQSLSFIHVLTEVYTLLYAQMHLFQLSVRKDNFCYKMSLFHFILL